MWRGDAPLELDVAGFETALAQAKEAEAEGDPAAAAVALAWAELADVPSLMTSLVQNLASG